MKSVQATTSQRNTALAAVVTAAVHEVSDRICSKVVSIF